MGGTKPGPKGDEARGDVLEDAFGRPAGPEGVPKEYVERPGDRTDAYNGA